LIIGLLATKHQRFLPDVDRCRKRLRRKLSSPVSRLRLFRFLLNRTAETFDKTGDRNRQIAC